MTEPSMLARALPLLVGVAALGLWEAAVRLFGVPVFILPAPSAIASALVEHRAILLSGLWTTTLLTLGAFALAVVGGVALAFAFASHRLVEMSLFPYAVVLQVTPVIAIAPLIVIWVGTDNPQTAILILAFIVAFFPILSTTTVGLRSADRSLVELFKLYGASAWQTFIHLRLPSALPYLLAGMKVSGGLSLIAVVTAEFVAGSGGSDGLAWRIMEASFRLEIAKMFAALVLLAALGIAIYGALSLLERRLLARWHEAGHD